MSNTSCEIAYHLDFEKSPLYKKNALYLVETEV